MSKVLRRLFHRQPAGAEAKLDTREDATSTLGSPLVEPANDRKPLAPPSDEETVERQIAALMSAWNEMSLCARREFLTRIDQRIMTTHWIRTARGQISKDAAAD